MAEVLATCKAILLFTKKGLWINEMIQPSPTIQFVTKLTGLSNIHTILTNSKECSFYIGKLFKQ